MRAAVGISRTFFQSFFLSGDGPTAYVRMNVTRCRAIFVAAVVGRGIRLWNSAAASDRRLQRRANNSRANRAACPTSCQWHTSRNEKLGGVVEWLMAPVLKTGRAQALVGSNPTPSAGSIAE